MSVMYYAWLSATPQNSPAVQVRANVFCGALPVFIAAAVFTLIHFRPVRWPSGHCQSCGYNLLNLETPQCPECGVPR
jgi:hypothetical protein